MANEEQLALLKVGVEAWNEWRVANMPVEVDLGNADLSTVDLRKADLHNANLHRAYLPAADLREANLGRANLSEANLAEADLFRAKLMSADLSKADLTGADLWEANLIEANLTEANLINSNFYEQKSIMPSYPKAPCMASTFGIWKASSKSKKIWTLPPGTTRQLLLTTSKSLSSFISY